MDKIFLLRIVLSFLVGGGYMVLILWLAKRFGHRASSALLSTPTTILVGSAFLIWQEGAGTLRDSLPSAALYMAPITIFTVGFMLGKSVLSRIIISLLVWFPVALLVRLFFSEISALPALIIVSAWLFVSDIIFRKIFTVKKIKAAKPKNHNLIRFCVAGFLIAAAVIVSKLLGIFWGVLVATMPVMFLLSMSYFYIDYGSGYLENFAIKSPRILFGIVVFIFCLWASLGVVPVFLAYLVSWIASAVWAYFVVAKAK